MSGSKRWWSRWVAVTYGLLACECGWFDAGFEACAACGRGTVCKITYDYCDRNDILRDDTVCLPLPSSCSKPEDVCTGVAAIKKGSQNDAATCAAEVWHSGAEAREPCRISPDGVVVLARCY